MSNDLMNVEFEVLGVSELDNALAELTLSTQKKTLEGALMKAALPIMKAAKKNANKSEAAHQLKYNDGQTFTIQPGTLRKSIGRQRMKKSKLPSVTVRVKKSRGKPYPYYWHFVERGNSRMAATPYLRPAFEQNVEIAIQLFTEELRKRIDKLTQD